MHQHRHTRPWIPSCGLSFGVLPCSVKLSGDVASINMVIEGREASRKTEMAPDLGGLAAACFTSDEHDLVLRHRRQNLNPAERASGVLLVAAVDV